MSKLYFRYGTVHSAKTLNLLAVAHTYEMQNKKVVLIKPTIDTRYGNLIKSRTGLSRQTDILVTNSTAITNEIQKIKEKIYCILVDEAQFLVEKHVDELRKISVTMGIPVICYGLRTNHKTRLFEGSRRLMEISDNIEEIKTTCNYCNRKAEVNMKMINGKVITTGQEIEINGENEELYISSCYKCYLDHTLS